MTSAVDVMNGVVAALAPKQGSFPTAAEDRVVGPLSAPTQSGQYPRLKVRFVGENKQSQGRGSIGFTTTVTIRVDGEVSEPVKLLDDVNRSRVEAELTAFKVQIERAIINSPPLFEIVQQLISVSTQWSFTVQDTQLGGIQSDYTFEIYEDESDFPPPAPAPIAGFDVHMPPDPALTTNPAQPVDGPGFSTTSDQE